MDRAEKKCCLSEKFHRVVYFWCRWKENEILKREVILFLALNLRWQFEKKKRKTDNYSWRECIFSERFAQPKKSLKKRAHKIGSKCRHNKLNLLSSRKNIGWRESFKNKSVFCFMYRVCGAWSLGPTFVSQLFTRDDLQQQETSAAETLLLSAGKVFGVVAKSQQGIRLGPRNWTRPWSPSS